MDHLKSRKRLANVFLILQKCALQSIQQWKLLFQKLLSKVNVKVRQFVTTDDAVKDAVTSSVLPP